MSPLDISPFLARLVAILALAAALLGFGWVHGARHVQTEWDAASAATVRAEAQAVQLRLASNARVATRQAAINETITEGKDHEIAILTAHINVAERMRRGEGICAGSSGSAQTTGAGSGNSADPPGGLGQLDVGRDPAAQVSVPLREDIDRDFKAFKLAVEIDLATGRACQAFVRENGLAP